MAISPKIRAILAKIKSNGGGMQGFLEALKKEGNPQSPGAEQMTQAEAEAEVEANKAKEALLNKLEGIPGIASSGAAGLGAILSQLSMSNDGQANVGQGTLGGALSGGVAGAALGPLGILGGALLGGVGGFSQANQSNADFYDSEAIANEFKLSSKTVAPSSFGKGGFAIGEEGGFLPVQMELGESYVTPELEIYKSKATETHENMEDNKVTDVVKSNSFAFSNRKNFTPKKHAKTLLGHGYAHYSEDETFELEEILMSDVFGNSKKEIPYSKAITKVKNKFKVKGVGKKDTDLLTQITNQENKQARTPFINKLIALHEGNGNTPQTGSVQKFEGGGPMKIMFDDLFTELDSLEEENVLDYDKTNKDTEALFKRLRLSSGIGSLIEGLATSSQSTRVDPKLIDTRFSEGMFQELSPAIADQLSSNAGAKAGTLIGSIAKTSPGAAERVAPRMFDSVLSKSNEIAFNTHMNNLQQRRNKYKFLNKTGNFNRKEIIRAREDTRNLINKKRAALADVSTNFLKNRDKLDVNKFSLDREATGTLNKNRFEILQNRMGATGLKAWHDAQAEYAAERRAAIAAHLAEERAAAERAAERDEDIDAQGDAEIGVERNEGRDEERGVEINKDIGPEGEERREFERRVYEIAAEMAERKKNPPRIVRKLPTRPITPIPITPRPLVEAPSRTSNKVWGFDGEDEIDYTIDPETGKPFQY